LSNALAQKIQQRDDDQNAAKHRGKSIPVVEFLVSVQLQPEATSQSGEIVRAAPRPINQESRIAKKVDNTAILIVSNSANPVCG